MADARYRAILIGNSRFPNDPQNLPTLEGPGNDVSHLFAALTDPVTGLFAPTAVRTLVDRTKQEIHSDLEEFFQTARKDTHLLLYYSGHGLVDDANRLYLSAFDTVKDKRLSTALRSAEIDELIQSSPARTTLIILDCCYSGAFKGGDLGHNLRGAGRFLLTSCRGGELANDADQRNHTSAFTRHLIEGLRGAAPELYPDGHISLDELYTYVYAQLKAEGKQLPQRHFASDGDVALARRRDIDPTPPSLRLSETTVDLDDVHVGEDLPAERIYVSGTDRWTAETTSGWIAIDAQPSYFDIALRPVAGINRASVIVRDPASGVARTVRITVRATPAPAGALAELVASTPRATAGPWSVTVTRSTTQKRTFQIASGGISHLLEYENHVLTPALARLNGQVVGKTMENWQTFDFDIPGPDGPVPARLEVSVNKLTGSWVERCRLQIGSAQVYAEGVQPRRPSDEDVHGPPQSGPIGAVLRASALPGLHVRPDIPADMLANARQAVDLDPTAQVLAVLDLTLFGSAKQCLVFGSTALHIRPNGSSEPTRVPYTVLRGRTVSVLRDNLWARGIDLGDGTDLDLSGPVPARAIAELINHVKAALG